MKRGELAYQVKIELVSMFDGYIDEPVGDLDEEIEALVKAVSSQDPDEALKDVYQTIMLIICRACRNDLVKDWDVDDVEKVVH